jgi:hypothetical protein
MYGSDAPPSAAIVAANAFAPDLVVLTGDYLARERSGVQAMREQLGGLAHDDARVGPMLRHALRPAPAARPASRGQG